MNIRRFFRRRSEGATAHAVTVDPPDPPAENTPSAREVFKSPQLLADWVSGHFINGQPLQADYQLLPDADARKDLEITPEQRDRCLREYSVLRLAGVSLFVKQYYPDEFWLSFTDHTAIPLQKKLSSETSDIKVTELREALESYVLAGEAANTEECADLYLRRIYDDNPNFIRMRVSGLGMLANEFILSTYDIFRDAYCQVQHGVSYAALQELNAAMEKASKDEA